MSGRKRGRQMDDPVDLFIIGGGVNGAGIARDAAGRGLSVRLAEQGDLAQATSSASTKLFHGGLRYLEYLELRLVREALSEREVLLAMMPHISWPMRFVLPYDPAMRFDATSPVSRLVGLAMPWLRGRRPAWQIRAGLFLYDHLGGRKLLPGTRRVDLSRGPLAQPLDPRFRFGWEYSDCWVQDARLVVLNARDAAARGAVIETRTRVTRAARVEGLWQIETEGPAGPATHRARALVNAAGPWVEAVLREAVGAEPPARIRLVRGSHIVTRRLYDHDRCYFFQGADGRITFSIPFEEEFTLIGTTDQEHDGPPGAAICSPDEVAYLCAAASRYFRKPVTPEDVVWTYSGVRPLYDDGASSATAATRDYVLKLEGETAPILDIFGGKITTYRRLAEHALEKLAPFFPQMRGPWTAGSTLPGGGFAPAEAPRLAEDLVRDYPFLTGPWARRLIRAYGLEAREILGAARRPEDLGEAFGATLHAAEVNWLIAREWARAPEDILWRRGKFGLHLTPDQVARLAAHIAAHAP
ncbi:glycerol-3-phosphate dehydrogenase [Rhodobacter xanthinilyticus]|uniref:Glycerol-3-phosphate dehydrogenase n=2 Tax=Rhodobacter xanthinilyticus TaxID=1850250 RepID=A0A1D9MBC5_9RHOB|nr:glycerol-3-phosphate dehydrogenase [Rhodobacter xanthinilyticus]